MTVYSGLAVGEVDGSTSELFRLEVSNLADDVPGVPLALRVRNEYLDSIEIEWLPSAGTKLALTAHDVQYQVPGEEPGDDLIGAWFQGHDPQPGACNSISDSGQVIQL